MLLSLATSSNNTLSIKHTQQLYHLISSGSCINSVHRKLPGPSISDETDGLVSAPFNILSNVLFGRRERSRLTEFDPFVSETTTRKMRLKA